MTRTYREFGDLLSAYEEADEKWTPIQKAHEFLDSVNEDEIWEQRHAAAGALFTYIAELEGEIAKMKKYFHKPEHGSCCTCQKCGHIYDECRCDFDETYDENDILTARNAELEAFVNRLIEAGNTIVFETFEGYKKHGLFDFAPVNTWQVLVKDWLVKECER